MKSNERWNLMKIKELHNKMPTLNAFHRWTFARPGFNLSTIIWDFMNIKNQNYEKPNCMNSGDDSTDIFEVESNEFEQNSIAVNVSILP